MAEPTIQLSIDNSQWYNITAQTWCKRILVQEDFDSTSAPTADLRVKQGPNNSVVLKVAKGTSYIFSPPYGGVFYAPGQIVGAIQTASGAVTLDQIESQTI